MLRKILQLTICLMIILPLDLARADEYYPINTCDTLPLAERVACCQPQLSKCIDTAKNHTITPAYACCKRCIWGTINYPLEQYGKELETLQACQGGQL